MFQPRAGPDLRTAVVPVQAEVFPGGVSRTSWWPSSPRWQPAPSPWAGRRYPGRITVLFHNYPLDEIHVEASAAAVGS